MSCRIGKRYLHTDYRDGEVIDFHAPGGRHVDHVMSEGFSTFIGLIITVTIFHQFPIALQLYHPIFNPSWQPVRGYPLDSAECSAPDHGGKEFRKPDEATPDMSI